MADREALTRGSYPVGYEDGHWTIRVPGGPAFMANVVAALALAARDRPPESPSRQVYERLLAACLDVAPEYEDA